MIPHLSPYLRIQQVAAGGWRSASSSFFFCSPLPSFLPSFLPVCLPAFHPSFQLSGQRRAYFFSATFFQPRATRSNRTLIAPALIVRSRATLVSRRNDRSPEHVAACLQKGHERAHSALNYVRSSNITWQFIYQ